MNLDSIYEELSNLKINMELFKINPELLNFQNRNNYLKYLG